MKRTGLRTALQYSISNLVLFFQMSLTSLQDQLLSTFLFIQVSTLISHLLLTNAVNSLSKNTGCRYSYYRNRRRYLRVFFSEASPFMGCLLYTHTVDDLVSNLHLIIQRNHVLYQIFYVYIY